MTIIIEIIIIFLLAPVIIKGYNKYCDWLEEEI